MKAQLGQEQLPQNSLLLTCSSQEDRCLGTFNRNYDWRPRKSLLFRYDTTSAQGERNHVTLCSHLRSRAPLVETTLKQIVRRGHDDAPLSAELRAHGDNPVVLDISVISKRYLFVLLRWLDDHACWERLWIVYSEPRTYGIEGNIPLSFGVASVTSLPGFTSASNPSRPIHAVFLLGYEGDRALATYEFLQPTRTTLIIPDPPFNNEWVGRTEAQNRNLLATINNEQSLIRSDSIDPQSTLYTLRSVYGEVTRRSVFSRVLCPLGTKPQVV